MKIISKPNTKAQRVSLVVFIICAIFLAIDLFQNFNRYEINSYPTFYPYALVTIMALLVGAFTNIASWASNPSS